MFFGGNLWGVAEKLEYLKEMGVGVIYLNPIFKAYSNHKYDTADYLQIDSMFGGEKAFEHLLKRAESLDIKIILDGVFNHTGDNSLYFDRYGEYGGVGAYQSENSVYRKWFRFGNTSDEFESWWGIKILPRLNHETDDCRRFFTAENGVGAEYIKKGVAGWRLDVADELCDRFLDEFSESVKKASDGQAIVIGEVWENAATKEAYGKRRRYLRGDQLHSVMNYPIREGIIDFVLNGNAQVLADTLKSIYSTYPKPVSDALMNILGTHDTERILTVLGKKSAKVCRAMGSQLANKRLSSEELNYAVQGLMIAATLQYTVYGVPSLYYGDEAGVEGYRDPFCRLPYPWGRENKNIFEHYKTLGRIRTENTDIFATGEFSVIRAEDGIIAYKRQNARGAIIVVANANEHQIDCKINGEWTDLLTNRKFVGCVLPRSAVILRQE
jgi:glycosidase